MTLALKFKRADVDTFLDEITAEQYQEWKDYFEILSGGYKEQPKEQPKEQTPEEVETMFNLWAGMHNASLRAQHGRK